MQLDVTQPYAGCIPSSASAIPCIHPFRKSLCPRYFVQTILLDFVKVSLAIYFFHPTIFFRHKLLPAENPIPDSKCYYQQQPQLVTSTKAKDYHNWNLRRGTVQEEFPWVIKVLHATDDAIVEQVLPPDGVIYAGYGTVGIVNFHGLTGDRGQTWKAKSAAEPMTIRTPATGNSREHYTTEQVLQRLPRCLRNLYGLPNKRNRSYSKFSVENLRFLQGYKSRSMACFRNGMNTVSPIKITCLQDNCNSRTVKRHNL